MIKYVFYHGNWWWLIEDMKDFYFYLLSPVCKASFLSKFTIDRTSEIYNELLICTDKDYNLWEDITEYFDNSYCISDSKEQMWENYLKSGKKIVVNRSGGWLNVESLGGLFIITLSAIDMYPTYSYNDCKIEGFGSYYIVRIGGRVVITKYGCSFETQEQAFDVLSCFVDYPFSISDKDKQEILEKYDLWGVSREEKVCWRLE